MRNVSERLYSLCGWFGDIDNVKFSTSRTFWPLLMATRPRWPVVHLQHGVFDQCSIVIAALLRAVFELRACDRQTGAADWLKTESEAGKTSDGVLQENAGGNDTVPISIWHGRGMRPVECCCASWIGSLVLNYNIKRIWNMLFKN